MHVAEAEQHVSIAGVAATRRWVRILGRRYLIALFLIALLSILDQAVVQPLLLRHSFYAPVINVAGRQRMLSQRLTKAALAMQVAQDRAEFERRQRELSDARQQWSRAHEGLLRGDGELDLPGTNSALVADEFKKLQPHFAAMQLAATELERSQFAAVPSSMPSALAMQALLNHEQAFLISMDRIVGLYQQEAQQQLASLRATGLVIMATVLLLLLALGLLVVRPATRTIETQLEMLASTADALQHTHNELEQRVLERTDQLQQANASLQTEMRDREVAQAQVRAVSDQLAHAARVNAMGQLATGLAHELNQPLAAITNYAETADLLLSDGAAGDDDARAAIQAVKHSAMRAGSIVHRMRNFMRPAKSQRVAVDLAQLAREAIDLFRSELLRLGVVVNFQAECNALSVHADAIQIQQVLVNLIQNSLHAMRTCPQDARLLTVAISQVGDRIEAVVRDSGPGFSTADTESFFQPFFTTKTTGLGMGLSISRTIIQQHGGELIAQNLEGSGAEVRFLLPISSSHLETTAHEPDCVCR